MPQLPSIERTSLTTNLEKRYEESKELAVARGDNSRTFNAKNIGTNKAFTDAINGTAVGIAGQDIHSREFLSPISGLGGFTVAAKHYAKDVLKHDNTPYWR